MFVPSVLVKISRMAINFITASEMDNFLFSFNYARKCAVVNSNAIEPSLLLKDLFR